MICLRLCQPLMNLIATVYRSHAGYKPAFFNFRDPLQKTGGDGVVFFHLTVPFLKVENGKNVATRWLNKSQRVIAWGVLA
jgi:hypothetical protein